MASSRRFGQPEKLIKPCPPTNKECQCHNIGTPEGQYQLVHECYLDTIAPQFTTGTHVSIFCPKSTKAIHSHSPSCSINNTNNSSEDVLSYPNNLSADYFSSASSQEIPTLHLPSPQKNTSSDTSWHFTLTKSTTTTTSTVSPVLTPLHPSISDPHHLLPNSAAPNLNSPQRSPTNEKEGFNFSSSPLEKTGTSFSSFFGGQPATPMTRSRSYSPAHKRKHPKTSFNKLKSSFIDYITTNDEYAATMADTSALSSCSIFNVGVNFCIVDDKSKQKDALVRLTFSRAYPTCHDVNLVTSSHEHLDIIIGFNTGDFVWFDPISNRYSRINKNGIINSSSVTMVKWIPDSEDLFMACFDDGSIIILDKDRDDQPFHPKEPQSWAEEHFHVTRPGKSGSKHNPVVHWRLSKQGVTAFAFSPDKEYVATVGKDGLLRTVEYQTERLCDVFVGYYGRLLCVAWSPDGKYILTGGQDDLVTIWSFKENRIIARCQGHRSWVTDAAFDPLHCNGNDYRFASVGEDCKLLLWDFSVNALHKPKQKTRKLSIVAPLPTADSTMLSKDILLARNSGPKEHQSNSVFNANSVFKRRFRKRPSLFSYSNNDEQHHPFQEQQFLQQPSEATQHIQLPTIHPALSKCQVPFLRPIVKQTIHPDPCVDVIYKDDCIVTTDRRGRVRSWARPQ